MPRRKPKHTLLSAGASLIGMGKLGSDEDYSSHLGQQQSFLRVCPRSSLQDHAAQGDCLPRRMMRWPVYFL